MKLLFPPSGSSFQFRKKFTSTQIKNQVTCTQHCCYEESKLSSSTPHNKKRKTTTTKPISKHSICPFMINIHLDLLHLDWYENPSEHIQHHNHDYISYKQFKIGQHQLSQTMVDEISKLHNSNISSSIQHNILQTNNNISVPIKTILNHHTNQIEPDESCLTGAEKLLSFLKEQSNMTYFALYAKSADTPLLIIHKKRTERIEQRNNIQMTGYARVYPDNNQQTNAPQIDSCLKETLSEIMVKNEKMEIMSISY